MKIFLKTNMSGTFVHKLRVRDDVRKDSWLLFHMIAQVARFGFLDIKISGQENNPVALATALGEHIGKSIKDSFVNKKTPVAFFWPFEQSLTAVCVTFSGKPYVSLKTDIANFQQKTMLKNFFQAFSKETGVGITACTIDAGRFSQNAHKGMMYNVHHQFEGIGKAFGRVLRELVSTEKKFLPPLAVKKNQKRVSQETVIDAAWNLCGQRNVAVAIGAQRDPDHTVKILQQGLKQFAKAGKFDLSVKASGDDEHHVYEDLAIVLGTLFNELLGKREGIIRTAWTILLLPKRVAFVALDLGRGYCHVETDMENQAIQSMVHHWFESFSRFAKLDIVAFGIKTEHPFAKYMKSFLPFLFSEQECKETLARETNDVATSVALFQCLGESLKKAVRRDPQRLRDIPSTKGIID